MPSIDKLRHNIRHAVSLSAFSPNLIHRIRYFFLYTVTFRDYSDSRQSLKGLNGAEPCARRDNRGCHLSFGWIGQKKSFWGSG